MLKRIFIGKPVRAALLAAVLPLCAAQSAQGEMVNVVLKEWQVRADKTTVRAGTVTFRVENRGEEVHELVILKTGLSRAALPLTQVNRKVNEGAAGEVIGEIEEFPVGEKREASFTLAPGRYVLFCNIAEKEESGEIESHYVEGMHAAFTVE